MTLVQSAKLNGLDLYAYLSDVLKGLPINKKIQIEGLISQRRKPELNYKIAMGFSGLLLLKSKVLNILPS
jgi:hypothetical protein